MSRALLSPQTRSRPTRAAHETRALEGALKYQRAREKSNPLVARIAKRPAPSPPSGRRARSVGQGPRHDPLPDPGSPLSSGVAAARAAHGRPWWVGPAATIRDLPAGVATASRQARGTAGARIAGRRGLSQDRRQVLDGRADCASTGRRRFRIAVPRQAEWHRPVRSFRGRSGLIKDARTRRLERVYARRRIDR